jgi:hypothetical protein
MASIQYCKSAITLATFFMAASAFSATMTKADYDVASTRIKAEYKAEGVACAKTTGNEKDICKEKAKGKLRIARAELEYNRSGKAADAKKVSVAKADSDFAVAKEVCDDKAGDAKSMCRTEAKVTHTKALADAKMTKTISEAKTDASDDKRDADYKLATEKCSTLAGDAKAACTSAAKSRFGKS